jgi:hypothetical protein
MPSALLPAEADGPRHPELLSFLKGKDNPFDLFVAGRKPDGNFARYHVPSIHGEVLHPLNAALDRYRLTRADWENDLPRSGVLVILGARGMGKTHLVHVLQYADDSPRIVVAPAIYEPQRPFIEYLLHQLVRHFQCESDGQAAGTLELLADALARQVLVQAFHGMTEIDWIGLHVTGRWTFWPYLWGVGTKRLADQKRLMIADLEQREQRTILEVCARHEQPPGVLQAMALQHIEKTEAGHTLAGQIRRGLYTRLIALAFGGPRDSIYEFLLDGYTEVEAKSQPARATLVDELFQALQELCLLAGMPVVFAFDAMETLLGDPPDEKLCHAFFRGLADVLDSHRGIPFLLLAESGHWQKAQQSMSSYAAQRFQQGMVRAAGYGPLSVLPFPPITAAQLGDIVAARMKSLHAEFYEADASDAPAIFPFSADDLMRIARSEGNEPPLRQALQALRDRYDELVNGLSAAGNSIGPRGTVPPPERDGIELLDRCWQREQRVAEKRLAAGNLGALADELHAGIVKWLECLAAEGVGTECGRPASASNKVLGAHPTFGQAIVLEWLNGEERCEVGIGLLLGERRGMPRDLETKLKMVASASRPFSPLILLWPRGDDLTPPIQEHLPVATRTLWDQYEQTGVTKHIRLRAIAPEQLAPWLALPRWLHALATEASGAPADVIQHFVADRTAGLLPLVAPRS